MRIGQSARMWIQRESKENEQLLYDWLREHGPTLAKAYLRKGQALHGRRDYKEAHKALDICIHCDFDYGLNMIMRECGVADAARREKKLLRETEKKFPPREKRRRKRVVS